MMMIIFVWISVEFKNLDFFQFLSLKYLQQVSAKEHLVNTTSRCSILSFAEFTK